MEVNKLLWRTVLICIVSLFALPTVLLFFYSYEQTISFIAELYNQPDKLDKFKNTLLTRDRFTLLRFFSISIACILLLAVTYAWNRYTIWVNFWQKIKNYAYRKYVEVIHFWQSLSKTEQYVTILLFISILFSHLYFLFRFPFHIDERFTYLYFVNKGWLVSMAYYPNPNNHILFTLICNLADIFLDKPLLIMKIPAFLIGISLPVIYWTVLRYFFTFHIAFLSTALFSFAHNIWYYALQGRGYSLLLIFILISIASTLHIIRIDTPKISSFFWFWLSSTLGFYTIPIFLYPFIALLTFASLYLLIERKYRLLKWLVICSILVISSVAVLYLPVTIFNGWAAVFGNSWVLPLPWADFIQAFPQHLLLLNKNLWDPLPYPQWILLFILFFGIIICFNKNYPSTFKQWILLFFINLIVIVACSIIQRVLLFSRLLTYLAIFQYLLLALAFTQLIYLLLKQTQSRYASILLVSILYICLSALTFYKKSGVEQFSLYKSFDNTAEFLFESKANHIFVNVYEYSLCIRFLYETNQQAIEMDTNQPANGVEYHYLVMHNSRPFPSQISSSIYTPVFRDEEVIVYKRR